MPALLPFQYIKKGRNWRLCILFHNKYGTHTLYEKAFKGSASTSPFCLAVKPCVGGSTWPYAQEPPPTPSLPVDSVNAGSLLIYFKGFKQTVYLGSKNSLKSC